MQAQSGAWKDGFRLVEYFAGRGDGAGAVRRTLRRQGNVLLGLDDVEVRGTGQSRLDQSSAFVTRSAVVRCG